MFTTNNAMRIVSLYFIAVIGVCLYLISRYYSYGFFIEHLRDKLDLVSIFLILLIIAPLVIVITLIKVYKRSMHANRWILLSSISEFLIGIGLLMITFFSAFLLFALEVVMGGGDRALYDTGAVINPLDIAIILFLIAGPCIMLMAKIIRELKK